MNSAKIFFISEGQDELKPMVETAYATEDVLQGLLARYPDLLPGDQIAPEAPRRWMLVKREMGVPSDEGEGGRMSLDHLFLTKTASRHSSSASVPQTLAPAGRLWHRCWTTP